jgi:hypothetical protein
MAYPTSERAAGSTPRCVITSGIAASGAASKERASLGTETVSKIAEIRSGSRIPEIVVRIERLAVMDF